MAVVQKHLPLDASLGSTLFRVCAGVDPQASLLFERAGNVWSVSSGAVTSTTRVASAGEETGVAEVWRGGGLVATEYRFRGGLSRYADRDELYIVVEGGGKIKYGAAAEPFSAGDIIDLGDYVGVYALEIDAVSTLLKIAKEEA